MFNIHWLKLFSLNDKLLTEEGRKVAAPGHFLTPFRKEQFPQSLHSPWLECVLTGRRDDPENHIMYISKRPPAFACRRQLK